MVDHHAVKVAQQWWDDQPAERQIQIHRWVSGGAHQGHPDVDGQLDLLEGEI